MKFACLQALGAHEDRKVEEPRWGKWPQIALDIFGLQHGSRVPPLVSLFLLLTNNKRRRGQTTSPEYYCTTSLCSVAVAVDGHTLESAKKGF